jgi:hypothetical protein
MKMENIKQYVPSKDERFFGRHVTYYEDSEGRDWYANRERLTKDWKVGINDSGVVCCVETDVTMMDPKDLTVIDFDELPVGISIDGSWLYINDQFTRRT